MKIEFGQSYLQELYERRTCKNKKYKFQPGVINGYIKCINMMASLESVEDLYLFNSLHFSLSQQDGKEVVITVCTILELSNHYK